MKMRSSFIIFGAALALGLSACGGGGGGGANSGGSSSLPGNTSDSSNQVAAIQGIAGLIGSTCSLEAAPETRMLDMDKAGYVAWFNGRVSCKLADGSVKNISGLPITAFSFTGNGVTNSTPEDLVTGTSSIDGATTYSLQVYRHFASAAAVTFTDEALTISGQDGIGQTINAKQVAPMFAASPQGLEDWVNPVIDTGAGGTVAVSRVMDADGMGYKATTYVVAEYAQHLSSSPACPVAAGVKDYVAVTTDQQHRPIDARYCMYTGLDISAFSYTQVLTTGTFALSNDLANTWKWRNGSDAGTIPTLVLQSVSVEPITLPLLRTPIYKLVTAVRFPRKPNPSYVAVEGAGPGIIVAAFPQTTSITATSLMVGTSPIWNR